MCYECDVMGSKANQGRGQGRVLAKVRSEPKAPKKRGREPRGSGPSKALRQEACRGAGGREEPRAIRVDRRCG